MSINIITLIFLQIPQLTEPKIEISNEVKHNISENSDSNEATSNYFNNADMDVVIYNTHDEE